MFTFTTTSTITNEIDLHGLRPHDVEDALDLYLDRASIRNFKEVRIIHGNGSGILKQYVHKYLNKSEYVDHFQKASGKDGGSGATIVRLLSIGGLFL
jgi:DNA mismatch repair protein MutS2